MKRAVQLQTDPQTAPPAPGSAFDDFFAEHRTALFGALWLVTRDWHEAEELTQDAFVKVWERWGRVREFDDPVGYLYRTGMNLFRNADVPDAKSRRGDRIAGFRLGVRLGRRS
jgi:DNA-directed RNA polymerase specialized sigma24 family protein